MALPENITVGTRLPQRKHQPDAVQLFLYNAALWNAHRIHFDRPYATESEGYPDLVVPGPLMGDWLTQCVLEWLGDHGRLLSIEYANRQAAYVGEVLTVGGRVSAIDHERNQLELELYMHNDAGDDLTPGKAVAELAPQRER